MVLTKPRALALSMVGLLLAVLGYLLFWPVAIEPTSWSPLPIPPLEGPLAPNARLARFERLPIDGGVGPEKLIVDDEGRIVTTVIDGRILRLSRQGGPVETLGNTGGRPIGIARSDNGIFYIADCRRGLLSLDPATKKVEVIATESGGIPFGFPDDVAVAKDGMVYLSDASSKWGEERILESALEHRGRGRLIQYNPATKDVRTLVDGLCFANGVVVSDDQKYVLVNETMEYCVRRYDRATNECLIFSNNLPGFPDNISVDGDGYLVALYAPRDPSQERILASTWLRTIVYRLPSFLRPAPKRLALAVRLDKEGKIVESYWDRSPTCYAPVTTILRRQDALFLGSLSESSIARIDLKKGH